MTIGNVTVWEVVEPDFCQVQRTISAAIASVYRRKTTDYTWRYLPGIIKLVCRSLIGQNYTTSITSGKRELLSTKSLSVRFALGASTKIREPVVGCIPVEEDNGVEVGRLEVLRLYLEVGGAGQYRSRCRVRQVHSNGYGTSLTDRPVYITFL